MTTRACRQFFIAGIIGLACTLGAATSARAEGFISPLIGFDFGGDASCPAIDNCQDKRLNFGVALGALGNVFGFEEEFSYAQDFFGKAPNLMPAALLTSDNNSLGWDVGGGLMITVAPHVAVRGDIRYFHAFQNMDFLGFTVNNTKLDFGRAAAALNFTF